MQELLNYKLDVRTWLFKAFLFLSVFAFSGFNPNVEKSYLKKEGIELVEYNCSGQFQIEANAKKYSPAFFASPCFVFVSNYRWALLNYNRLDKVMFKYNSAKAAHPISAFLVFQLRIPGIPSEDSDPILT